MTRGRRGGFALVAALFAIVLIGVLVAGALFAATQERLIGRGAQRAEGALAAAELGVGLALAGWDSRHALGGAPGDSWTAVDTTLNRGRVSTRVTKLSGALLWVVAEAHAGGIAAERQRVGLIARLVPPRPPLPAALVAADSVRVAPGASVDGLGAPADSACAGSPPGAGVAVADTALVTGSAQISGTPSIVVDTAALSAAVRGDFGNETYDALAARAAVTLAGGSTISPRPRAGCAALPDDWGDPLAPPGDSACSRRAPIVHASGDLRLAGPARGQGMLLVDGTLLVDGAVDFRGVVVARGGLVARGGAELRGAVISGTEATVESGASVVASRCAVERALLAAARPRPVRTRAWIPLY